MIDQWQQQQYSLARHVVDWKVFDNVAEQEQNAKPKGSGSGSAISMRRMLWECTLSMLITFRTASNNNKLDEMHSKFLNQPCTVLHYYQSSIINRLALVFNVAYLTKFGWWIIHLRQRRIWWSLTLYNINFIYITSCLDSRKSAISPFLVGMDICNFAGFNLSTIRTGTCDVLSQEFIFRITFYK